MYVRAVRILKVKVNFVPMFGKFVALLILIKLFYATILRLLSGAVVSNLSYIVFRLVFRILVPAVTGINLSW